MAGNTPRGLIHPTADDKIKDGTSPSALADDFKALADSADASIAAAEGAAKSYADSGDTSTLNAAKADATSKANNAKDAAISDASAKYGGLPQRVSMLESTTRAVDAPAGFNPNDVTGQAVHTVSASDGAVNMPPSESQSLTVLTYPFGGAALQQLAYSFSISGAEFWSRVKTTGGWSAWSRLDADKWADRLDSLDSNVSMNLAAAKTYADTKKSEAIADATTKYGGLPSRMDTVESTAVYDGDGRLMEMSDLNGLGFAVVDDEDRRSWIEFGTDLKPTPYAASLVGESLGFENVALDSDERFVVVDEDDRIIFSDIPNDEPSDWQVLPRLPSDDWAHWGDSMTDDVLLGADGWSTQLSLLTGRNHYNGGWYNQKANQIAARQGALPTLVTVQNNVTASTGATTITGIINNPAGVSSTRNARGTLAGVLGTIRQPTSGNWTFTPDVAGSYPIPPKSKFISEPGIAYRGRTVTIWAGRNDIWDDGSPEMVIGTIQAMIDNLGSEVKRVLVMEVPPASTDGSNGKAACSAMNNAIHAAFPQYWLPIATWLRSDEAATAAGVAYTSDDLQDIADGFTPRSFRSDNIHLSPAGSKAVAHRVYQEAQKRGWL